MNPSSCAMVHHKQCRVILVRADCGSLRERQRREGGRGVFTR